MNLQRRIPAGFPDGKPSCRQIFRAMLPEFIRSIVIVETERRAKGKQHYGDESSLKTLQIQKELIKNLQCTAGPFFTSGSYESSTSPTTTRRKLIPDIHHAPTTQQKLPDNYYSVERYPGDCHRPRELFNGAVVDRTSATPRCVGPTAPPTVRPNSVPVLPGASPPPPSPLGNIPGGPRSASAVGTAEEKPEDGAAIAVRKSRGGSESVVAAVTVDILPAAGKSASARRGASKAPLLVLAARPNRDDAPTMPPALPPV